MTIPSPITTSIYRTLDSLHEIFPHKQRQPALPQFAGSWEANQRHNANTAKKLDATSIPPLACGSALHYPDSYHREKNKDEEIVRLIETSSTLHFFSKLLEVLIASYYNLKVRTDRSTGYRVHCIFGGERCGYPGAVITFTPVMNTMKILLNNVVEENA